MILKCLREQSIPIYGKGENIRDWLYVEDHCRALLEVVGRGTPGETYNIGGNNERTNLELVQALCGLLDELRPAASGKPHADKISFVRDRPGHDLRYAIDATKIESELGWQPREDFEAASAKPFSGIWTTKLGGSRSCQAATGWKDKDAWNDEESGHLQGAAKPRRPL